MKLIMENWRKYLKEESVKNKCEIPLDNWKGSPPGMRVYTHSTTQISARTYTGAGGTVPSNFLQVVEDGFRIDNNGGGSLSITMLDEGIPETNELKESLRKRVRGDRYNLGQSVLLAAFDPPLLSDRGITSDPNDDTLCNLGPIAIQNVNVFEEYPEGHRWHKSAWRLPGRFVLALYDGETDTICLNPSFTGQTATEYGKRLANNLKKYDEMCGLDGDVSVNFPVAAADTPFEAPQQRAQGNLPPPVDTPFEAF